MSSSRKLYLAVKRATDVTLASIALVTGMPFALLIALFVRIGSPGPILFRQERIGQYGRSFTMYKFRTMMVRSATDMALNTTTWTHGVPDDFVFKTKGSDSTSVTPFGRVLRRTSLDEFPQFLNVIRGDMSLVGPRPEIPEIAEHYSELQATRLKVQPGITGWAQVNGRGVANHRQKIAADLYYVKYGSLRLDMVILLRTAVSAFIGRGAF